MQVVQSLFAVPDCSDLKAKLLDGLQGDLLVDCIVLRSLVSMCALKHGAVTELPLREVSDRNHDQNH